MSIYDFSEDVRGRRPQQSRLLVDDDFSWSDLPRRRNRVGVTDVKSDRYDDRDFDRDEGRSRERDDDRYDHYAESYGDESPAPRRDRRRADPYALEESNGYEDRSRRGDRYELDYDDAGFGAADLRGGRHDADDLFVDEQLGALALSAPGRRTIVITGHGAERNLPVRRRNREAGLRIHERSGFRPDRIALWAFLLGLALVLGATTSSHAAVFAAHHLSH